MLGRAGPSGEIAPVDVDAEIGRLYELPPEEFIAARDQLGRKLREAGDRTAAQRVRARRRPTVAAWAVNQAAQKRPELVAELLEAGAKLRQAQRRALSGLRDSGLRAASAERRKLLDRLQAAAADALAEAGRPAEPHRDAIAATFEAASVDGDAAVAVRSGTLERELPAPAGFGEVTGLELLQAQAWADRAAAPETARAPARRRTRLDPARRRELQAARRRRDELRRKARESARAAAEAREAADRAQDEADAAEEAAERLAGTAREARRAAEDARRVADEARREAEAARERMQRVLRRSRMAVQHAGEAEEQAWSAREALEEAERRVAGLEQDEEERQ
jgi:hypothetical protein